MCKNAHFNIAILQRKLTQAEEPLTCVQKVPSLYPCRTLTLLVEGFPQSFQENAMIVLHIRPELLLSNFLPIRYSLLSNHLTLYNSELLAGSLNKQKSEVKILSFS